MAAKLVNTFGDIDWGGSRDREGHREYWIEHLVVTDSPQDGPVTAIGAPGLPLIGHVWNFGNDLDIWAVCLPDLVIKRHSAKKGEPHQYWTIRNTYSTKPLSRCQDEDIEDPLLEPPKVSGSFVKYLREATQDKDGAAILNSSHEPLLGNNAEFDNNRPTVRIGMNTASLGLATFAQMVDTVNDANLWGLGPRKIKLSNVSWERKILGTCGYYYTRNFEFDIDYNTFDRTVTDKGTKVFDDVNGNSRSNPDHFKRYTDAKGNPTNVQLDGNGSPATSIENVGKIEIQYYGESNFLALGIPTSF